ncbi:hypothetical protein [Leptobacterium sp. I13]|uniref:hypothetical protein n=1 Tax=Leptobacterium meishanense TaxID=3128904 RepID=UPI0030EDFC28
MKNILKITIAIIVLIITQAFTYDEGPQYDSAKTKGVIDKMLKAHGGYEKWLNAPSFSYGLTMYMPGIPLGNGITEYDRWRLGKFQFEPKTSKGSGWIQFQNATIVFDGKESWGTNYKTDKMRMPPFMRMFYHYGFINLPFLTQSNGTKLGNLSKGKLPNDTKEYITVEMTFEPKGRAHKGKFVLYIDPDTNLLKATKHNASVPEFPGVTLPDMNEGMELIRIMDGYIKVDGFTIPDRYSTITPDGKLMGMHIVIEPSFEHLFDSSKLKKTK